MPVSEVFNIDCMDALREAPDNHWDLAICDPPYGIGADEQQNESAKSGRISNGGRWKEYKPTQWDRNIPTAEYFNELLRVSKNQIIWGGNYYELPLSGVVVWFKGYNGTLPDGEFAKASFKTFRVFSLSRVDAYINCQDVKIHPTQKPVALYKWLLTNYAKTGQKILDTHLGSGSSRIAAYDLGFDFTGYELDTDYFNAQEERFAIHCSQGKLFAPVEELPTVEQSALFGETICQNS